jgi:uncharacterized iron-regulated membrane protein
VWGLWVMGVVGIVWALDCFVGFYLTLPSRGRGRRLPDAADGGAASRSFWRRWTPAWRITLRGNLYRVNFDVHRALGLWFWAVLLTLAVSGVYLSLPFDVFRPAMSMIATLTPSPFDPARAKTAVEPGVSFAAVVARAHDEASRRGWQRPFDVFHSAEFDLFGVGFGDHHAAGTGVPYLFFNGQSGAITSESVPGKGRAGDVFLQWLFPLHSGQIAGVAGRIVVAISGLAVAVLSVSGVVSWAKKRQRRRTAGEPLQAGEPAADYHSSRPAVPFAPAPNPTVPLRATENVSNPGPSIGFHVVPPSSE